MRLRSAPSASCLRAMHFSDVYRFAQSAGSTKFRAHARIGKRKEVVGRAVLDRHAGRVEGGGIYVREFGQSLGQFCRLVQAQSVDFAVQPGEIDRLFRRLTRQSADRREQMVDEFASAESHDVRQYGVAVGQFELGLRRQFVFRSGEQTPLGRRVERRLFERVFDGHVCAVDQHDVAVSAHHLGDQHEFDRIAQFVARGDVKAKDAVFAQHAAAVDDRSGQKLAQKHAKRRRVDGVLFFAACEVHARILRVCRDRKHAVDASRAHREGDLVLFGHIDLVDLASGERGVQFAAEGVECDVIVGHLSSESGGARRSPLAIDEYIINYKFFNCNYIA